MRKYYNSPSLVDISVTNRCNLNCDFCYASSSIDESKKNEISIERLSIFFKELDSMNVHRVSITGGEPFIREDIFDILYDFNKFNFAKVLNTNATLIDSNISKKLSKLNLDRICVSLDGSNRENHELIRGKNTFNKTLKGILEMQKFNLPVSTLFTLQNNNIDDLIKTIKLNEDIGIKYMSVMVVCPTGRAANKKQTFDKLKWYSTFNELTDMKKNDEIKLNFKIVPPNESPLFWLFYFPLKEYNRLEDLQYWNQTISNNNEATREISCQAGIRACSISYNGDVYGCDLMMGIDDFKAGNITNRSFNDIWENSNTFKYLRSLNFEQLTGTCKNCNLSWCGGGCRSAAYNLDNSILGSDKTCFYKGCENSD